MRGGLLPATSSPTTPAGGQIQVILERVNSHAEIVVEDTGIGIKREFLPHVRVLDPSMPKLDGIEVARWIQQQSSTERPVLIALTGWGRRLR